jgi:hypothetical protein
MSLWIELKLHPHGLESSWEANQEIPRLYGIQRFITVFTRAQPLVNMESQWRPVYAFPVSPRHFLMLSSRNCICVTMQKAPTALWIVLSSHRLKFQALCSVVVVAAFELHGTEWRDRHQLRDEAGICDPVVTWWLQGGACFFLFYRTTPFKVCWLCCIMW